MAPQQKVIVGLALKRSLPAETAAQSAVCTARRSGFKASVSSAFKKMIIFTGLAPGGEPANTKVFAGC
jgi:hypothetical protein